MATPKLSTVHTSTDTADHAPAPAPEKRARKPRTPKAPAAPQVVHVMQTPNGGFRVYAKGERADHEAALVAELTGGTAPAIAAVTVIA
jgi:hypothetical protein